MSIDERDLLSMFGDLEEQDATEEEATETEEGQPEGEQKEETEEKGETDEKDEKAGSEGNEENKEEREVSEELKNIVELLGKDVKLKSKGLEAKIDEFTPEEVKTLAQKGLRFYQAMEELARERSALAEREKALEYALKSLEGREGLRASSGKESGEQFSVSDIPPELLEVSETDSSETVALKKYLKSLGEKVEKVSKLHEEIETKKVQEQLLDEIKQYKEEYPLASVEEVLAVHFLSGGKIPIQKVMETSHRHYGSTDFVKEIFKTHPEVKKTVADEIIKGYLATKKTPSPSSRVTGSRRPVDIKTSTDDINFDNVGDFVKKAITEKYRFSKED